MDKLREYERAFELLELMEHVNEPLVHRVLTTLYQKGHFRFRPYYVIDEETGKVIPLNLPTDAVNSQAKPGTKAGNPLLDEINERLREEGLIEKLKRLYREIEK